MLHNWLKLLDAGKLVAVNPLPGAPDDKPKPFPTKPTQLLKADWCQVTRLDVARIGVECGENSLKIHAPEHTRIDLIYRESRKCTTTTA